MQCTAKNKSGKPCKANAVIGSNVCRMHGAKGGRPVVTGLYSKVIREGLKGKLEDAKNLPNPLDATEELALMRAILTEFLDNLTVTNSPIGAEARSQVMLITDTISKQVDRIIKQRNETALTTAEVKAIKAGMESLVNEFVPADRRRDYLSRLRSLIPG